ncbi:MAG: sulfite oxidase [Rubrobacter sp.]|nr:sulfite oxidase [Rubrobacter sp.]
MYKATGEARITDVPKVSITKPLPPETFIDHREGEESHDFVHGPGFNAETRWEAMPPDEYLTPTDIFYVRSHAPTPHLDAAAWRLEVEGDAVERSFSIGYEELLGLPSVAVVKMLECAGNGRIFFGEDQNRETPGTQWRLGAVGVAEWTGVPLREILERANVKPSARDVMAESLDEARMRRPIPIGKALDDAIVAYAMNGETLPLDHGFPARLVVPGWAAVASVKWLGKLTVSSEPLFSPWNTEKYVLTGGGHDGSPITNSVTKSAPHLAWDAEVPSGPNTVRGRSWTTEGSIARVEWSLDGGEWRDCDIEGPNLPEAWATWEISADLPPGRHTLRLRATDTEGNTQPEEAPFNDEGYLYGAVVGFPIHAT